MARREPLRSLHRLCESQKQVSTAKLEDYLLCAGDELAGYAEILRDEFNNIAAAPAAPTADGTTSDKYRAELYDEVWQRARDMGYGNVTDALVELERMKAAAPAVKAEQEPVGHELDGLAGDLLVAADLVRNKAVSSRLVEYSRHVAKLAYCTPAPDAALVEALREAVEYLDDNTQNQISSGSKLHCLMRNALAGKGGAQ